ncbi:hypothetical protein LOTGIDRAFT_154987 [Lottia gigantea]|uniref:Uncharacterized protein n=1 Tax=Lottia gigantea TaxID=225164 RepID=V4B9E1_LOTGI|nr:hypothetical protein LOTGIDRAFT_154987 [Lottia gigantea]ESO85499.1 hypothetical protein LOTGIDRAFT_154987 [Lottia gigantea]
MNGGDVDIADNKDLVEYSEFLHMIRKTGPETRRLKEVDLYVKAINQDDEYAEDNPIIQDIDNPITQQIDELEEEIARENCGQGITFISDNNEELLNRLEIILAAMKEGHRSDRQYNEVNCILKRFLEKDYEYELDRNEEYELGLKYFSVYNSIRIINENNNQMKISTDNGATFKTISLLPGSYEYVAINEYLSEYARKRER